MLGAMSARLGSAVLCLLLGAALAPIASCADDTSSGGAGGGDPLGDVQYQGGATDEALEALLAATPKDEPARAPVFDFPLDGAELPSGDVPIFKWHAGATARANPPPRLPAFEPLAPTRRASPVDALLGLALAWETPALAHGTPITGPAFLLTMESDGTRIARLFTTGTEYLPNADTWAKLKAAKQPLKLTLLGAEFETNRVAQDGGPWQGTPVTVTVGP